MARQERNSVDYFPHPVTHGKKMFYLRSKYGNNGYSVWFMILEQIGKTEFHYLDLSNKIQLMYLSSELMVDENTLLEIVNILVDFGEFDKELWECFSILWNEKFIENIRDAYKKRNNECIDRNSLLVLIEAKGIPNKCKGILNQPKGDSKDADNTQSKVKKTKLKETIEERKRIFYESLVPFAEKYEKQMLRDFYNYWSESDKTEKLRWEKEVTYEIPNRLATWYSRSQKKEEKSFAQKEETNSPKRRSVTIEEAQKLD